MHRHRDGENARIVFDRRVNFLEKRTDVALMLEHMRAPDDVELAVEHELVEVADVIRALVEIDRKNLLAVMAEKPRVLARAAADVEHRLEIVFLDQAQNRVE